MTPEEQARADAINNALSASIQKRKAHPEHAKAKSNILEPNRKGPAYYCGIIAIVALLHLGGFFVYTKWQDKKEAQASAVAAERRRLDAEYARLEEQRRQIERQAQTITSGSSTQHSASAASTQPKRLAPAKPAPTSATSAQAAPPAPPRQQYTRPNPTVTQPPAAPSPAFTDADHTRLILDQARTYFSDEYAKHLGVMDTWVESINTESIFHDKFWDKYVVKGKVTVGYRTRGSWENYKRTLEFEGETKIKDGKIQITSNVRPK